MHDIAELVDGYRRFRADSYPKHADLYRTLAETGQSPKVMVIACCDSRADPATIFGAGPGQLFVVRNVANLVPPFEPDGDDPGTSAALEFAVTGLEVETILVMGHTRCGGVRAFLDGLDGGSPAPGFVARWMSRLDPARTQALRAAAEAPPAARQQALEHASIRHSIDNLKSFPFIAERVSAGRLRLRGACFDIADGRLLGLDPDNGNFAPVS